MPVIEHPNAKRVERIMNRVQAILVAVIPALFLLASVDGFAAPSTRGICNDLHSSVSLGGQGKHQSPSTDNAFDQVIRRWSRRVNLQPGSDGLSSPAAITPSQLTPLAPRVHGFALRDLNWVPAQCWQFHWRTALEPRAPSSLS